MTIKVVPIKKNAKFIVITKFGDHYLHYHLDDLSTVNKYSDIGVWNIKYKNHVRP